MSTLKNVFSDIASKAKESLTEEGTSSQTAPVLTSNFGYPSQDLTHSFNVNGYVLASDVALMEKQQMFNRSKICERMVHPCGSGAFGHFELTKDMSEYCKADFLKGLGKQTPVFARFSTVTYGREYPDSGRNPRGFALKFYTDEGNYDLVGLNFPIFFVRDPALGPDVILTQRRNPQSFLLDFNAMFDFMSLVPESLHCATMFFSDHGTPYGFRFMHGYGCHTFKWVNDSGQQYYVKYHFISQQGVRNMSWDESVRMSGEDPDFAKRDLFEHIAKGGEASWKACVQIMPIADADKLSYDPFDVTKVWPHSDYPLTEFGRLVINKNPENYHRDVEEAAFSPGSLVPGIEPSPDALLNFRMFFYRDTQLYRLGANLHQIPVNCPFAAGKTHPLSRDGLLRVDDNGGDNKKEPHYVPNSIEGAPKLNKKYDWQPIPVPAGSTISRTSSSKHENNLEEELMQVRELYLRVMSPRDRQHLHYNLATWLKFAKPSIQKNMLTMLYKISPEYASGVINHLPHTQSDENEINISKIEDMAKRVDKIVDSKAGYTPTSEACTTGVL